VKPVPVSVAALIITAAVPVDVRVTDCVATVFTVTLPKATLVALILSIGAAAFNCRAKLLEMLPALAVRVTAGAVATDKDETVAVNPALVAFAATVTVFGTVTVVLLLDRPTVSPPLAAAAFSVTVQASVPAPVIDELLHESALNIGVPVPLRLIAVVALVEELLVMSS
jgi:hypothetical protein